MLKTFSEETTVQTGIASTVRSFFLRLAVAAALVLLFAVFSRAGGPKYIAGTSYFNADLAGQPLTWPQGQILYYTDQGDLSPILPNASANSLVASAFGQWTVVGTAALAISRGGALAEDVNGSNVSVENGIIPMPADIQPSATGSPVGVVYDYDGSVTDALIGEGAGDASQCFFNSVFGGDDNYGALATYQHALIVINGQCAQKSSQLADIEYRLVRTIGSVLGLEWSQANLNVITGTPTPTSDDYAGFPLMHYTDPPPCVPITNCFPNPYQLSADDIAAVSRLYPVTAQNQANYPGTQVFSAATARIHGSVWFTDAAANPAQPMQGVNVVARWIDTATGLPSRKYVVTSVSGFLFSGNAGNPVSGFADALGNPLSDWGSSNPALEGFFDLAGLPLPGGGSGAYQLSVETIDPIWSMGVGPYEPDQVTPSGSFQPILLTLSAGQDVAQDILMTGAARPVAPWAPSETWTSPAQVPRGGNWAGSLSTYGEVDYFQFVAQANRTFSVAVSALDETGGGSEGKLHPLIGMWAASDPQGTLPPPAFTPSPFNTTASGMTRLDAQVASAGTFIIGIADLRGDGRPDYRYQASVLYADAVSPQRLSVNGGALTLSGVGFSAGLRAAVGNAAVTPLAVSAGEMILAAPAFADGPRDVTVVDPATGSSSTMTGAVTYGAAPSDNIVLLSGMNPSTPVGTQATNLVNVRVLASDGVTPVGGATVGWSASNGLQLSACGGASSCSVITDQSGNAATGLSPAAPGISTITAELAPGVYVPSKSVQATLSATESSSDLGISAPFLWVAQGATVNMPLTARVLSNGTPQANATVNFSLASGSAGLSSATATTDANGNATVTLLLSQFTGGATVNACVAPSNAPCKQVYASPVPLAQLNLQPVAGAGQVTAGQGFSPIVVRVVDSSSPPHPVLGVTVVFQTTVLRPGGTAGAGGTGETIPGNTAMPVILSVSQSSVVTDVNGLASFTPSSGGFNGPLEVDVGVTAGTNAVLDDPLELLPAGSLTDKNVPRQATPIHVSPVRFEQGETKSAPSYSRVSDNCR